MQCSVFPSHVTLSCNAQQPKCHGFSLVRAPFRRWRREQNMVFIFLALGAASLQMRAWYTHQQLTPVQTGRRSSLFRRLSNSSWVRCFSSSQARACVRRGFACSVFDALRHLCRAGQVENIRLKAGNLRNRTRMLVTSEVQTPA